MMTGMRAPNSATALCNSASRIDRWHYDFTAPSIAVIDVLIWTF